MNGRDGEPSEESVGGEGHVGGDGDGRGGDAAFWIGAGPRRDVGYGAGDGAVRRE